MATYLSILYTNSKDSKIIKSYYQYANTTGSNFGDSVRLFLDLHDTTYLAQQYISHLVDICLTLTLGTFLVRKFISREFTTMFYVPTSEFAY